MIYCVLSEPCVHISSHKRNEQGPHELDKIGTGAINSRATLSKQRLGVLHLNNTAACAWRAGQVNQKMMLFFESVFCFDPFQVSSHFPNMLIFFLERI